MSDHTWVPTEETPVGNPTGWNAAAGRWKRVPLRRVTADSVRLFDDGVSSTVHDGVADGRSSGDGHAPVARQPSLSDRDLIDE